MAPDYGYGVETSYTLYLFFIFSLLFYYYYLIIIINTISKLDFHFLMALRLN